MSGVPFRLGGVSIYYGSAAHLVPWSGTLSRDPRFFQRAPPTPSVRDIGFVNTMSRCPGFADTMTHGAVVQDACCADVSPQARVINRR